jgi:flavin-dependent dehydrogenase
MRTSRKRVAHLTRQTDGRTALAGDVVSEKTDLFVIGGGPVGLAAAIAARQKGFEVLVADGAKPPVDKSCGEGLLPEAVEALDRLGVRLRPDDGFVFKGIRFLDKQAVAEAAFPRGKGIGVNRVVLHEKLMKRAEECGVRMLWSTPVTGISQRGVQAGGQEIQARWIVGADGTMSGVRRWMRLGAANGGKYRYASRRHYGVKLWTDFTEVYWGQGMQAYVTPVGAGEVCVVVLCDKPQVRFEAAWKEFPALGARLSMAQMLGRERGAVTAMHSLERVCNGRVALLGDASGGVDAITGEGLHLGFQQAMALASALGVGDLSAYQDEHRRLGRRPAILGKLLLLMGRHAALRRRAMNVLAGNPRIFSRLLALHSGESSAGRLVATSAQLGWNLLLS